MNFTVEQTIFALTGSSAPIMDSAKWLDYTNLAVGPSSIGIAFSKNNAATAKISWKTAKEDIKDGRISKFFRDQ